MSLLPKFDKNGNLPSGIYKPNIDEVIERFRGEHNLVRASRTQSLMEFIEFLRPFAIAIYIDGSYITSKLEPGDVDLAVILPPKFNYNSTEGEKLLEYAKSKDYSHLEIRRHVQGKQSQKLTKRVDDWTTDRDKNPKGILYLELNP